MIQNADESDAGIYACKAENLAGSEIKPITLGIGSEHFLTFCFTNSKMFSKVPP